MRIFYVCQRVPFPPDRGDKITTYNEILHLAKSHDVDVFCLADGPEDLANVEGIKPRVSSVTAVPVTPLRARIRAAKALVLNQSLSVEAFDEPALHRTIKAKYAALKPDLFIVYSCNVAQYAAHFPRTARIMQFADLDSLKWQQYAARAKPPMSWIYRTEESRLLAYERMIAKTFSHSLVCTDIEKRDFERLIPGIPVTTVSNGVDLEYFRPQGGPKGPQSIVFTGVMDYLPNVDAVEWFATAIFPIVRESVPDAKFTICGSRPSPQVKRLASLPGVTVTGRVPDTRPYLDAAEVFVAPLRIARGIQNKLLEALAMALPSVASRQTCKATVVPEGEGLLAEDEPRAFAAAVVRLLKDDAYRAEMARKARLSAQTYYTWQAQMELLDRVIVHVTESAASAAGSCKGA
jgi:sugar transferase (PEP-CTERM/EpsH1 system associated)